MSNFELKFSNTSLKSRLVGANAVIVKDNQVVEKVSYGYRNLEEKVDTTADTIYRIASISKVIVAICIMQLVEKGKLSINDDISDILGFTIRNPYYPNDPITVKMLMTQTSSIADGYDDENPEYDNLSVGYNGVNGTNLDVKLEDLLIPHKSLYWTDKTYLSARPGTKFEYSNFGCGILACIVEKASNKLFNDYVIDNVLKPLKIDGSFRVLDIAKKDKVATLYYPNHDNNSYKVSRDLSSFLKNQYPEWEIGQNYRGPAGGLFTSMEDLSKIMVSLMNDGKYQDIKILEKETVDLMLEQHWNGNGSGSYKAKGLQLKIFDYFEDKILKGHSGDAYGVKSFMFFNKEENIGICYITNGGYYSQAKSFLQDCQEDTLKAFIEEYWPNNKKNVIFQFSLNKSYGYIHERKINFYNLPLVKDDIYIPSISLAEGLQIVPDFENDYITFKKYNRSVTISLNSPQIIIKDGFILVPTKHICEALCINIIQDNEIVSIYY